MLQMVGQHGQAVHVQQLGVAYLGGHQGVKAVLTGLVARQYRTTFCAFHAFSVAG